MAGLLQNAGRPKSGEPSGCSLIRSTHWTPNNNNSFSAEVSSWTEGLFLCGGVGRTILPGCPLAPTCECMYKHAYTHKV